MKKKIILVMFVLILCIVNVKVQATENTGIGLSTLRLQYSGISPEFDSAINEYYLTVGGETDNIEISATSEAENAIINISGNNNLQYGVNTVTVEVTNPNEEAETYYIYITKTDEPERANAELENLAIKQGKISPEFNNNTTRYSIEIPYKESKIDILAVPQSLLANVNIEGPIEMQVGENKINIIVQAENKVTTKKYEVIVYRRNESEEIQVQEESKMQIERLSTNLRGDSSKTQIQPLKNVNTNFIPIIVAAGLIMLFVVICYIIRKKK